MKIGTTQVIDGMIAVASEIADGSEVASLAPGSGKPLALSCLLHSASG